MWFLLILRLVLLPPAAVSPVTGDPAAPSLAGVPAPRPPVRPGPPTGPRPPKRPTEKRPVEDTTWGDLKNRFGGR